MVQFAPSEKNENQQVCFFITFLQSSFTDSLFFYMTPRLVTGDCIFQKTWYFTDQGGMSAAVWCIGVNLYKAPRPEPPTF